MSSRAKKTKGYVHGFSKTEQQRLFDQAKFLESYIYDGLDFSKAKNLIEVGSGVGAQTTILLERFPNASIDCVDLSDKQLLTAKKFLATYIKNGRVRLHKANAEQLPFEDNSFDGAFVCWFLEHLPRPVKVLQEINRVLRSGGRLFCNETLNSTLFIDPYSPGFLQYNFALNDHHWNLGGDPFIGAKLGNLLQEAGYHNISTKVQNLLYDNRQPKMRAMMLDYYGNLLLSGAPELLKAKKVTAKVVNLMKKELAALKSNKNAVFFDAWVQASGFAY